ncbi:dihydrolipoamide acetyltransferase family protein [Pseudonocardia sp. N23]|uniref:dihydrolipoamide acetyltransferase family protein n=1 Tax=Pseudonocardia sp. N23 TaxID=1987376 RepID=UPI000BFB1749|nr:dihydrolipoamide acetyltransferase family protein [Pseudonocardia sp. N23]GAY07691.1 dihydrolipoamide acetyltransferase component of pyruvate dehydrogenase complex [Pseudonocardia sp. N23]
MAAVMRMPELAANTPEATLVEWLVAEGASVAAGDAIASAETAKATVDIEAEIGGHILRLVATPGSDVAVGAPLAVIGAEGESLAGLDLGADGPDGPATGAAPSLQAPGPAPDVPGIPARPEPTNAPGRQIGGRIFASPLARKLVRDEGLDLSELRGTGPGGRIVRRDVTAAVAKRAAAAPAAPPVRPTAPASTEPTATGHDIPHTRLRRAIASRLTESKQTAPHFYVRASARVDALLALREQINEHATSRISVNDLVVMAVAKAHQAMPRMNVIWTPDSVRQFDSVDIAVAVATADGLVTPVVRSVETMNVSALATATRDFAARARDSKLRPDELEGGSITVTNLGMYGTEDFAAIINPPQSSILAVGAARESVVVEESQCVVARTMRVTLSVDHRPIDGAVAAQWMQEFVALLESPLRIVT